LPSPSSSPRDSFLPLTIPVLFGQQLAIRPSLPLRLLLPRSRLRIAANSPIGITATSTWRVSARFSCGPRRVCQPARLGSRNQPADRFRLKSGPPRPTHCCVCLRAGRLRLIPMRGFHRRGCRCLGSRTRSQQTRRAPAETMTAAQRFLLSSRYGLR